MEIACCYDRSTVRGLLQMVPYDKGAAHIFQTYEEEGPLQVEMADLMMVYREAE